MTSALRWGLVASTTPRPLYPRERPGTHCTGGWVGPRAGLDRCGKSRPPPGFDPLTVQFVASRYTDWAIPDHGVQLYVLFIIYLCSWHVSHRTGPTYKNVITVDGFSGNWHSCSPCWWCTDTETCSRYAWNVCIIDTVHLVGIKKVSDFKQNLSVCMSGIYFRSIGQCL